MSKKLYTTQFKMTYSFKYSLRLEEVYRIKHYPSDADIRH